MASKTKAKSNGKSKDLIGTKKASKEKRATLLEEFGSLDAAKKAALKADLNWPKVATDGKAYYVCNKRTARKRGWKLVARKDGAKMVAVEQ